MLSHDIYSEQCITTQVFAERISIHFTLSIELAIIRMSNRKCHFYGHRLILWCYEECLGSLTANSQPDL